MECVAQYDIHVCMRLLLLVLAADSDLAAWHRQVDLHLEAGAVTPMRRGSLDDDMAADDVGVETLESLDMLLNACEQSGGGWHVAKCRLKRGVHENLLKPESYGRQTRQPGHQGMYEAYSVASRNLLAAKSMTLMQMDRRRRNRLAVVVVSLAMTGAVDPGAAGTSDGGTSVYVVRRAWHTGIAIPAAAWPDPTWPVLADFPDARYFEFGWGDAVYYQSETKTVRMALAAVLWPSDSVIEVIGTSAEMPQANDAFEAVEIRASAQELAALVTSVRASFADDGATPTGELRAYADGPARFYAARGKFGLLKMCNAWTAERLKVLGCSVGRLPVLTSSRVLREARRCEAARRSAPQ